MGWMTLRMLGACVLSGLMLSAACSDGPPHWLLNNSFRAQAQINPNGSVCLPGPD